MEINVKFLQSVVKNALKTNSFLGKVFYLVADGHKIEAKVFNTEQGFNLTQTYVTNEQLKPLSLGLDAKLIAPIIQNTKANFIRVVNFNPNNYELEILADGVVYYLQALNPDDMPQIPNELTGDYSINVSFEDQQLQKIFKRLKSFVSTDEYKPSMNGINFKTTDKMLNICATDSFKLALVSIPSPITYPIDFTIPLSTIDVLLNSSSTINMSFDLIRNQKNSIIFDYENNLMISSLIEDRFPPYESIIPKEIGWNAVLEIDNLIPKLNAITKVPEVDYIQLVIEKEETQLTSYSREGRQLATTTILTNSASDVKKIVLSAGILPAILNSIKLNSLNNHLIIESKDIESPLLLIRTEEEPEWSYVCMQRRA